MFPGLSGNESTNRIRTAPGYHDQLTWLGRPSRAHLISGFPKARVTGSGLSTVMRENTVISSVLRIWIVFVP
jgi:hypothetical protein